MDVLIYTSKPEIVHPRWPRALHLLDEIHVAKHQDGRMEASVAVFQGTRRLNKGSDATL